MRQEGKKIMIKIFNALGEIESFPYSRKAFLNTAEHVWGYFKKAATQEEKNRFFYLLAPCRSIPGGFLLSQPESAKLLSYISVSYPSPYLGNSALLKKVPGTRL
ncbi:DUF1722 domain-containing protein [Fictibacillus sp. NRS-1165]|uniref:DUF1722 domain-containing protein n=1 Tax=Fictibacillus sp. NRS-1165 TaxID=3144463 RepID=UPI003D22F01C